MTNDAKGFTIAELLVAIAVAALYFTALGAASSSYSHTGKSLSQFSLSNAYVEGKVEALRNAGYNGLAVGTTNISSELPSNLAAPRSATLVVTSPTAGIKQVDISVNYTDSGASRTYSYTTYVGELGVGQ